MQKVLWFKPSFSHEWHIVHKYQYATLSLCRVWRVPAGAVQVERVNGAVGNCAACVARQKRVLAEGAEGSEK